MQNIIFFKPARQVENTGDLLINKVAIDLLTKHGDVVVDNTSSPEWFVNELRETKGVEILTKYSTNPLWLFLIKALLGRAASGKQKRYFLFYPPGHVSKRGPRNAVSSTLDLGKIWLLNKLGCKISTVGFTSGPFDGLNALLERSRSKCHHYYGVRDYQSLALTNDLKFKNVHYFPDFAWAFSPKETSPNAEKKNNLVISFRSNKYGSTHNKEYLKPILANLQALVRSQNFKNFKVTCVYQVEYDRQPAIELKDELSKFCDVDIVDKKLALDEAAEIYSNASYVISNRLHVLLLALQCGATPLPLVHKSDNRKITSIFEDNGLGNLILNTQDDPDVNTAKVNQIIQNISTLNDQLRAIVSRNTARLAEELDKLFVM
jgi:polysaccharide pyruvyl transferase WcaK-like protein